MEEIEEDDKDAEMGIEDDLLEQAQHVIEPKGLNNIGIGLVNDTEKPPTKRTGSNQTLDLYYGLKFPTNQELWKNDSHRAELDYGPDVFTLKEPSLFKDLQLSQSSESVSFENRSSPCKMREVPYFDKVMVPDFPSTQNAND